MKYKHVYAAHEARMWVMTIISGVSVAASILAANPELKEKLKNAFKPKKKIRIVIVKED
ncbi:MAG: hypothetical protein J6U54_07980 [Clostridiales bacterium]|nr:hypothetical protein [Clostridiales bacterium]